MFCEFRPKSELIGRQDGFAVTERIDVTERYETEKPRLGSPSAAFLKQIRSPYGRRVRRGGAVVFSGLTLA